MEHVVAAGRVRQLGDEGVAVLPVPEGDGLGRARLLTRGLHVTVAHLASRVARRALGRLDALHAHGALLHHPELAHRDVRIELQVERRRPGVVEPVELPHVVGAVVAAVARAHAAVVDLPVEAFASVVGGIDRAHRLARRDLAVLAEHGQEHVDRLGGGALLPALHPQPVLDAPVGDLGLPDGRHIVLALAGEHAGLAAGAAVHVHRHPPAVLRILHRRVHPGMIRVLGRLAAQLELARGAQLHPLGDLAIVLVELRLRDGQRPPGAGLGERDLHREQRQAARGRVRRAGQQLDRIDPHVQEVRLARGAGRGVALLREGAGVLVPLPHRHRHHAGMDELGRVGGQLDGAVRGRHLDEIPARDPHLLGGRGGNLEPGVPGHLGDRVRNLVQPRQVATPAVVETAGWIDHQRVRAIPLELRGGGLDAPGLRTERDRRGRAGAPHPAAPEGGFPELGERSGVPVVLRGLLPLFPDEVLEAGPLQGALALLESERLPAYAEEHVAGGLGRDRLAIDLHRSHRGLHEPEHAVLGGVVAPGLERVQRRQHQVRPRGGLVGPARERDDERDLGQGLREARLGRHRVDRIDVHQDQHLDLAGRHRLGQPHHVGVRAHPAEG